MKSQSRKHTGPFCSRFGTIAVELKLISIEQLKWALDEQLEDDLAGRPHRVLGAICFAHGWMTPEQIEQVLNRMFKVRVERSRRDAEQKAV
jgi:hypothetical protein